MNATYAFVSGPQYESKAECAMLRSMGADAVGMSTIPEVVAAHHAGMAVLCLSLITNKVVFAADNTTDTAEEGGRVEGEGDGEGGGGHAHHEEVLRAVRGRSEQLIKLVGEVVSRIGAVYLPTLTDLVPIDLETEGRVSVVVGEGEGGGGKRGRRGGCPLLGLNSPTTAPPAHCVIMGGAILVAGILLGTRMGKRSS